MRALALLLFVASPARAAVPEPADHIRVEKAAYDAAGQPIRIYTGIQLGENPVGPKHFHGDGRTPEGRYVIDRGNPASAYHLSLHVSYPDSADRAFAAAQGRDSGGDIFLHGQPNGTAARPAGDWTDGCVALSNQEIEEIWTLVGDGTPIEMVP
jgi:murein L,D-transpeptidase YafK